MRLSVYEVSLSEQIIQVPEVVVNYTQYNRSNLHS